MSENDQKTKQKPYNSLSFLLKIPLHDLGPQIPTGIFKTMKHKNKLL